MKYISMSIHREQEYIIEGFQSKKIKNWEWVNTILKWIKGYDLYES